MIHAAAPEVLEKRERWSREHLQTYSVESGVSVCLGPPSSAACEKQEQGCIQSCLDNDPPWQPLTEVAQWHRDGWKKEARCPIRIRVHWMGLEDVSTVNKSFKAKLWIQLKWREDLPSCLNTMQ